MTNAYTPTHSDFVLIRDVFRAIHAGDNEAAFLAAESYAGLALLSRSRFQLLETTNDAINAARDRAEALDWFDPAAKAAHLADLARAAA